MAIERADVNLCLTGAAVGVLAAGLAHGLDRGREVLVILGTALQLAALGYATKSVWSDPLGANARRVQDWIRRMLRRRRVIEMSGTATVGFSGSGRLQVIHGDFPGNDDPAGQIAWLKLRVDNLTSDVDALRNSQAEMQERALADAHARADELRDHVDRRFGITAREAWRAGLMAAAGAVLTMIGDLI
jgi:hypothetical protein